MSKPTRGMLLGKFMPPHSGHVYLCDFARAYVDHLTILVCTRECEPITGKLRYAWMRELCPGADVVHVAEDLPQTPEEHPKFWAIWQDVVRRYAGADVGYVFASETYGHRLAEVVGARYIPCDPGRECLSISGTQIRQDPMKYWELIPNCVRPYFVKRVCLFGPESTGKTTLARDLARHFNTVWVPEHARPLLDAKQGRCDPEDIPLIVRGQIASEEALARQANRVLFCDTDVLTTSIWSRVLFGACPTWIDDLARQRRYDVYLLLGVDVPWVDDSQRYLPHQRQEFYQFCRDVLVHNSCRFVPIAGTWQERFEQACHTVNEVIGNATNAKSAR